MSSRTALNRLKPPLRTSPDLDLWGKGRVREWLGKHERSPLYCTPTSAWWMNWVERFFADLTEDCVRQGSFASVKELVEGQCGRDSRQDSLGPPSPSQGSQWNHVTLKSVHKIGPEGMNRGAP